LKRVVDAPSEYASVDSGIIFLNDDVAAVTPKPYVGEVEPIPTRPFEPIKNNELLVEEATLKSGVVAPEVPCTERSADGVVVAPIPVFPFARILNILVPVDEATVNGELLPAVPCTLNVIVDDVALIPDTVPLSRKVEVPTVVAESQRVT
jgi:hypothetical protein